MRTVSYTGSDIFMICFSVVDPVSFENATKKVISYNNEVDLRDRAI